VQVKGLMPPEDGISHKTPTGRAVWEIWHDITYSAIRMFVIPLDRFTGFAIRQKKLRMLHSDCCR